MTASKALEAAGNAVIASGRVQAAVTKPSTNTTAGTRERLHELMQLREEGLIDSAEYERKRAEILGQL